MRYVTPGLKYCISSCVTRTDVRLQALECALEQNRKDSSQILSHFYQLCQVQARQSALLETISKASPVVVNTASLEQDSGMPLPFQARVQPSEAANDSLITVGDTGETVQQCGFSIFSEDILNRRHQQVRLTCQGLQ